jgi:hypothetical protein
VSTPLRWEEVPGARPEAFTIDTVPGRLAASGDPGAGVDGEAGSLEALLELAREQPPAEPVPVKQRRAAIPLIEIARAATKDEAMAALDRWKARHPEVLPHLAPADVLVDAMRGRSSTWTRIRLNLRNVPEALRPPQEALEVDYDPWDGFADQTRPT